jgi:FixJ family two-component response regulator
MSGESTVFVVDDDASVLRPLSWLLAGCAQPVVFMSGHGSVRTSVQAMRAGALDFIEKPWDNDMLVATVRRALERDREIRARRDAADSIFDAWPR